MEGAIIVASLSGVSSSNTMSSLMNSTNTISGLASGMDTEGMIESLVQSYQTKINTLNQKITKTEWKQDAYRSIISKMVAFSTKYTSYSSATNLTSPAFFSSAVKVATQGLFADRVAASGKTNSDISLDRVTQLATAAQYRTSSNLKSGDGRSIQADAGIDLLKGQTELGKLSGSLTLTYGAKTVSVSFDEVGDVKALEEIKEKDPRLSEDEALAQLIQQKLSGQKITLASGVSYDADERIKVEAKDGSITFTDSSNAGNAVYISGASGNVKETLGLDLTDVDKNKPNKITLDDEMRKGLTYKENNTTYLSNKTMNLSLDGTTKQINLPRIRNGILVDAYSNPMKDADGNDISKLTTENYAKALNVAVQNAFKGNKIKVTNADETGDTLQLRFEVQEGSDLIINTDVGETLGIGRSATSYLNTNKTLEDLLGKEVLSQLEPALVRDKNGAWVQDTDEKTGAPKYSFVINGVAVGNYSKDSTLAEILADINGNSEAGVRVSYSQTTKNFLFTSKETGLESDITIGGGLAYAMFGKASSFRFSASEKVGDLLSSDADYGESGDNAVIHAGNWNLHLRIEKDDSINDIVDKMNAIFQDIENQLPGEGNYEARFDVKTGSFIIRDKGTGEEVSSSSGEGLAEELLAATAARAQRADQNAVDLDSSVKKTLGMKDDETLTGKKFSINANGKTVEFTFDKEDVSLDDVLSKIESDLGNGARAYFSGKDGSLQIVDRNGKAMSVTYNDGADNVAEQLVNQVGESMGYTKGQDAKFTVTVNGEQKEMVRSTNSVTIDGMTITMKDTFDGYKDAEGNDAVTSTGGPRNSVTFKSTTDSDKIVDAIKSMIEDYNVMMAEIKSAYSTLPYQKTDGTFTNYEPLTDDDRAGMTESAIERYEEKAKQGILFGDRTLSTLYEKMRNAFNLAGADGGTLRAMGITTTFSITDSSEGVVLDEDKLRDMLESDPDRVADVFTKTSGVMQTMKAQLDSYSKTTGEPKGILIQQAGSPLSSLSLMNNTWQKEIDNINTQIGKWQDKLVSQVERYTSQFTRLEMLINQMNSQSSTLAGLMGG